MGRPFVKNVVINITKNKMRQLATIQKIEELRPIEGADKIEAARVKGWWVVTQKGRKVGDTVVYFEIDSFLPDVPRYEFLKKGSSLKRMLVDGDVKVGIRLKTIKLRGQISQGLILPIEEFTEFGNPTPGVDIGIDVSDILGVLKYEPPMPAELSGKSKGFFPGFIPKTDEERIQNMADILNNFYVTEKLDGTSVTYFKKDGIFGVCSRNLELVEGETTQWKLARTMDLANKLPDNFALQGELVGESIQGNPLNIKGQEVYFFNAYNITSAQYLNYIDLAGLLQSLGLKMAPVLDDNFSLPNNIDYLLKYAEGKSVINPDSEREGVVVRPKVEMKYKDQRFSFKAISNKYLLNEE